MLLASCCCLTTSSPSFVDCCFKRRTHPSPLPMMVSLLSSRPLRCQLSTLSPLQPQSYLIVEAEEIVVVIVIVVVAPCLIAHPSPVIPHHTGACRCPKGHELSCPHIDFPMADCCLSGGRGQISSTCHCLSIRCRVVVIS